MTRDFTLSRYEALCKSLISSSYRSITVQEYIQGQAAEPIAMMRHDVYRKPQMAGMDIEPFDIQEKMSNEFILLKVDSGAIEFTLHAREKMLDREIKSFDIKQTLLQGEIIEEYLDYPDENIWLNPRKRR